MHIVPKTSSAVLHKIEANPVAFGFCRIVDVMERSEKALYLSNLSSDSTNAVGMYLRPKINSVEEKKLNSMENPSLSLYTENLISYHPARLIMPSVPSGVEWSWTSGVISLSVRSASPGKEKKKKSCERDHFLWALQTKPEKKIMLRQHLEKN